MVWATSSSDEVSEVEASITSGLDRPGGSLLSGTSTENGHTSSRSATDIFDLPVGALRGPTDFKQL